MSNVSKASKHYYQFIKCIKPLTFDSGFKASNIYPNKLRNWNRWLHRTADSVLGSILGTLFAMIFSEILLMLPRLIGGAA